MTKDDLGRTIRNWALICAAGLLLLAFGPGCGFFGGEEEATTANKIQNAVTGKARPAPPKTKAPATDQAAEDDKLSMEKLLAMYEEKAKEYVWNPEGMNDPFRPIEAVTQAAKATESQEEADRPKTPLERMELSQLKLVAIIMAGDNSRALVEDSAGMGYIIQPGTYMGTRAGQVAAIYPDRVEVEEYFKNYLGERKKRISMLKLKPIEGE
ncbi:MAG: pilus assembly protein PilP [Proteobacteria bacterium]|nr:pilus assembly protein PilP [Pseudomonadota bacterium]